MPNSETLTIVSSIPSLYEVIGTCEPTAVGDYSLLNESGGPLQIASDSVLLHAILSSPDPVVGGANVYPFLSLVSGGPMITALTGNVTVADVNNAVNAPVTLSTGVKQVFLNLHNDTLITSGKVRVRFLFMNAFP